MTDTLTAYIYRSNKKAEMYLYLANKDAFDCVPEPLLKPFGEPEFAMEVALTPERKLARENTEAVINNLLERGFHLQMPPKVESLLNSLNTPE